MTTTIVAEEWRAVVGFEGWYEVSNLGRIKRTKIGHGTLGVPRILRCPAIRGGYRIVRLYRGLGQQTMTVHKVVAEAFLPPRKPGQEVNHRNFDPGDNRAENLEWVTHTENMRHSIEAGRHEGWGYANAGLPTRKRERGRFVR